MHAIELRRSTQINAKNAYYINKSAIIILKRYSNSAFPRTNMRRLFLSTCKRVRCTKLQIVVSVRQILRTVGKGNRAL